MRMNNEWNEMSLGERIVLSAWMATRDHLAAVAGEGIVGGGARVGGRFGSSRGEAFGSERCEQVDDSFDTGEWADDWLAVAVAPENGESEDDTDASFREGAD